MRAVFRRQSGPSRTLPGRLRDIRQSSSGLVSCPNEWGSKRFSLIETLGGERVSPVPPFQPHWLPMQL